MKRISRLLLMLMAVMTWNSPVTANPISLVCISTFPPYAWLENGVLKGIDVDIVDELFNRAGLEKTVQSVPAQRAIVYLMNGTVDGGFSGIKTPEREKIVLYADAPIHRSAYRLFVKKGNEFPFHSLEDLFGKTIGRNKTFVISNEFAAAEAQGKIKVDDGAITVEQNLQKLMENRFDALAGNENEIRYAIKMLNLKGKISELPHPIIDPVNVYLAFSKASKLPNKEKILSDLSRILVEMESDGTIARIHDNYLN